ncbi:hypothetical protein BDV30DRAFT_235646 [Aspergillus minisclerotigenes]|uniref:Uncharacterized protein n=1 Tax=Aspergillus minisclerotigenes TaxID=656917 RepID=A0A5N6JCJ2_9EURO|nr:hypothetical protein BDV30DRAFT_235646 [Aspergillus minisclerotigenes]
MAAFGSLQPRPHYGIGTCGICRQWIGPQSAIADPGIRAVDIFESSAKWKRSVEKHGYVSGHVSELQKMYFRHPWFWTWLYRAFIYNKATNTFWLTGVGFAREVPNGLIQLPVASEQFYICRELMEREGIKLTEAIPLQAPYGMIAQGDFDGIAVHERCWTLTTRLLGIELVKAHLKEFTQALRAACFMEPHDQWMTNVHLDSHYWGRWLRTVRNKRRRSDVELYLAWSQKQVTCLSSNFFLRDPLRIHDIPVFLSVEEKRHRQSKNKQRSNDGLDRSCMSLRMILSKSARKSVATHAMCLRSDVIPRKALALPPELIVEIMDFLPGSREIRLLLWVYPPWGPKVPWSYWRTRFRKDLMLEMGDLPDINELDWRHAYYSIERLCSTSHGLHNRERVLKRIENIKIALMDGLQKERERIAMSKASPLR